MHLSTPRLLLRALAEADAEALLAIWTDPAVAAVLYPRGLPPAERVEAWVKRSVASPPRVFLALHEEKPVGYAGIQPLPSTGEPELFYAMRGDAWGRGFATEAGAAVLAHAREALGLDRVVAVVHPANPRSARVLEKLGFREAGMMPHAGEPHVRYELDLTSWSAR